MIWEVVFGDDRGVLKVDGVWKSCRGGYGEVAWTIKIVDFCLFINIFGKI